MTIHGESETTKEVSLVIILRQWKRLTANNYNRFLLTTTLTNSDYKYRLFRYIDCHVILNDIMVSRLYFKKQGYSNSYRHINQDYREIFFRQLSIDRETGMRE